MSYETECYKVAIFYGSHASLDAVTKELVELSRLAPVPLAMKGFGNHETPSLVSFRKRSFSETGLCAFQKFAEVQPSYQFWVFDRDWSEQCPPKVLTNVVTWTRGTFRFF